MAFWRGAFSSSAFWVGETIPIVLDDPNQGGTYDFDAPTALGVPSYIARAQRGEVTAEGFASVGLVRGFAGQATRAEVAPEGFSGGIQTPTSYNAILADVDVVGRWPGTGGKSGGLLETASDADGDPLSFEIMSLPAYGTLQVEFNGAILYVPNRGFSGLDGFTWRPWANGEPGNTVTFTLLVEPDRVVLPGEAIVVGFSPTRAGLGLNAAATLGEVTVTGFASVEISTGFQFAASLAEVVPLGSVPTLPPGLQALSAAVDVVGFAGTVSGGWTNRATIGVGVDPQGLVGVLSIGWLGLPLTAEVGVEGFISTTVGYVQAAVAAAVTVTGLAPNYLELPLQAQTGVAGPVTGFVPALIDFELLPPTTPERPSDVTYYNPRNHLPAGQILDRETDDVLMAYWASVDYRVLTDTEMEILCGNALPNPVMKREFGTGEYPRKTGTY